MSCQFLILSFPITWATQQEAAEWGANRKVFLGHQGLEAGLGPHLALTLAITLAFGTPKGLDIPS